MNSCFKRYNTIGLVSVLFLLTSISSVFAYSEDTHVDVNYEAVSISNLDSVLKDSYNLENGYRQLFPEVDTAKTIRDWVSLGGKLEDVHYWDISINHFHDPTKSLDQAGFSGLLYGTFFAGESSILWAQDSENNLKSWPAARQYLYDALTSTSETERAEDFKNTFLSVGQVMHLIEDSSVPLHVMND